MAYEGHDLAMDIDTPNPDDRWPVSVERFSLGTLRTGETSIAWRLRSSEALDGSHYTPSSLTMVFL